MKQEYKNSLIFSEKKVQHLAKWLALLWQKWTNSLSLAYLGSFASRAIYQDKLPLSYFFREKRAIIALSSYALFDHVLINT